MLLISIKKELLPGLTNLFQRLLDYSIEKKMSVMTRTKKAEKVHLLIKMRKKELRKEERMKLRKTKSQLLKNSS